MNMSSWFMPTHLKNRFCHYFLDQFLGQFLKEELRLDQLSIDLYNGKASVENVTLNEDVINEMLAKVGLPMEVVNGYVQCITVIIPWKSITSDSCEVQIKGLEISLQPKCGSYSDVHDITSSLYHSLSEMTTSMQLAEGFKKEANKPNEAASTGFNAFADLIEGIMTRAQVSLTDVIIRVVEPPNDQETSVAVEICIDRIDCFDEVSMKENHVGKSTSTDGTSETTYAKTDVLSCKCFRLSGVEIFLDEVIESTKSFSPDRCPSPIDTEIVFEPSKNLNNEEQTNSPSEPVLIAKLYGRHELKVRFSQNEFASTPKIDIDCLLGSFVVNLSPHQVHLLLRFVNNLSSSLGNLNHDERPEAQSPDQNDPSHTQPRAANDVKKPRFPHSQASSVFSHAEMTHLKVSDPIDFRNNQHEPVDSQYAASVSSVRTGFTDVLNLQHGKLFQNHKTPRNDKEVFSSSSRDRSKRQSNLGAAVNCRYQVHIDGFVVTLLHSNPFPTPDLTAPDKSSLSDSGPATDFATNCNATEEPMNPTSVHGDQTQRYFASCALILSDILENEKPFSVARDEFAIACGTDHLRLIVDGVHLSIDGKPTLNLDLSFGKAELTESLLVDRPLSACNNVHTSMNKKSSLGKPVPCFEHSQLIKFLNSETTPSSTSSDVRIRVSRQKNNEKIRTSLHVHMAACETEVDISIIDRINALLSYSHLTQKATSATASLIQPLSTEFYSTHSHFQKEDLSDALCDDVKDQQVDVDVSCSFLRILFRFPVADLRPEVQRRPWYTRSLRDEILILEGHSIALSTSFAFTDKPKPLPGWGRKPSQSSSSLEHLGFEVTFKDLHVLYSDVPDHPKSFIYISQAPADRENSGTTIGGVNDLDYPFIKVTFRSTDGDRSSDLNLSECETVSQQKTYSHDLSKSCPESEDFLSGLLQENRDPSPFSQTKVMYTEKEIILPGNAKEISNFSDHAISTSRIHLLLKLPAVNMFLESHSFFENLYNRINNDILLWTPAAPKPHLLKKSFSGDNEHFYDQGRLDLASRLSIHLDDGDNSSTGTWSGSDDRDGFDLHLLKDRIGNNIPKKQGLLSITTKIGYGKVLTKCNILASDKTVSDTEHGEVVVMLENAAIFYVTGYCGDPNLDYVSIQIENSELFHKAGIPSSMDFPSNIGVYSESKPIHLDQVIGKCCEGITNTFHEEDTKPDRHMVNVAIKIETRDIGSRHFTIAAGLNEAFLQHRFAKPGCNWFEHVCNFFDANDDPIPGYVPPEFVTEVHLSLSHSAVAYKPLYMSPAVNAVATVKSFFFNSNSVMDETKSMLSMMIDRARLYITNKLNTVDLIADYASVVEIDFLDIRFTAGTWNPLIEFSLANNMTTIRSCTDSCILLCSLIQYISDSGDFRHTVVEWEGKPLIDSTDKSAEYAAAHVEEHSEEHGQDCDLADLLADAVLDLPSNNKATHISSLTPKMHNAHGNCMSQSMMEIRKPFQKNSGIMGQSLYVHSDVNQHRLGVSKSMSEFADDDDFCVIGDELLFSKPLEPLVKYRDYEDSGLESRILVVENHFEPRGKIDQLQAPESFPTPVFTCTLHESSFVWYMYGGKDFNAASGPSTRNKSHVGSSASNSKNVSSPVHTKVASYKRRRSKNTGSTRDSSMSMELHVAKVSVRYEKYPDETDEAERFVLAVNSFEIKDKLQSSSINKFLYRFHTESSPRRANTKAMLVKVLQIRPDGVNAPLENKLRISLQPLRLNVDQDSLNFLTNFFTEITGALSAAGSSRNDVDDMNGNMAGQRTYPITVENMVGNTEAGYANSDAVHGDTGLRKQQSSVDAVFFREVIFSPAVPIRLDYCGKRIDTEQGTVSGLLMGLGQLNCSELCLKKIVNRRGLLGVDKVVNFLLNEWASDIRANQLPSILGGLGPLHSVTQIVKGVRDLLYLPVQQYRKDGRIVRGIQRGASSFGTSTAMATLEVANGAVGLLQSAAETTHELISPSDTHTEGRDVQSWHTLGRHARRSQPADLHEGMSNAYTVVKHGVENTANSIAKQVQKEHEKKGVTAAVGVVLRHIPPTVVLPLVIATEATSNLLSGIRNQMKPDAKQQDEDKWKNT